MDPKQIKELMTTMERHKIQKLHLKEKNGVEITLERETQEKSHHHHPEGRREAFFPAHAAHPPQATHPPHAAHTLPPAPNPQGTPAAEAPQEKSGYQITSPMVGTFYPAPTPDEPAFVKKGDSVTESTVVCIVEAMKVMNEVKAGVKGVVKKVLVNEGEAVEFGTALFEIEET